LRSALSDREALIVNLQQENADLQTQVDKLSKMVNSKDKRIRELEKQVKELTERIDAMNGGKGEAWVGGTD
jgi:peptidoglycan hydrolase CwlO-like protein